MAVSAPWRTEMQMAEINAMAAPLTQALAQYVRAPSFGGQEAEAIKLALMGTMDTLATLLAGQKEPVVRIVRAHLAASGAGPAEAPAPSREQMLGTAQAAMVNAVAGHALDYDDVAMSAHPSTVLVPALWAEAHRLGASGAELLRAYVVGYEVWAELFSRESGQYHLKGWHPTGVFGVVGAAAGVAYLNRAILSEAQVAQALSLAASSAAGLVANFGTMAKPWHAGRAASAAIDAVRLAQLGMTAATDVFEHRAGFLAALSPSGACDLQRPAAIGGEPRLLSWGLSIKRYPVCYSGHRVIDGVLQLKAVHCLQPQDVQRVEVTIGNAQASMLRNHRPVTGLEAKFSIEFDVASALVAGEVGLAQLTDAFTNRPEVQALMAKVQVHITERNDPTDPAFSWADRVCITTCDGSVLETGEIRFPKGHAMHPLSAEELRSKFLDCVAYGGMSCDGAKLYDAVEGLAQMPDVRTLVTYF